MGIGGTGRGGDGFGSSAHITAQIAAAQGAEVFVMTRGEANRELATELGVPFVGDAHDEPPAALDSAIVFAPAGGLVPVALEALAPGGTVAIAGIYLSDVPPLDYERHLFYERDVRSVTSNTRADGDELLRIAGRLPLTVHSAAVGFDDVGEALADLADGRASGSLVRLPRHDAGLASADTWALPARRCSSRRDGGQYSPPCRVIRGPASVMCGCTRENSIAPSGRRHVVVN